MQEFIEMCQKLGIDFESGRIEVENILYIITKDKEGNKVANYFFKDTAKSEYINCYKHG